MIYGRIMGFYNFMWMLRTRKEQQLAWEDARLARIARERAEERAAEQMEAMLAANPSGQLGKARLNDKKALRRSGLL